MRIVLGLFLTLRALSAQQTIFDVPSADVSGRGAWFYQHQSVARAWRGERRWLQTHAFGYGLGGNVELDATWFNIERGKLGESAPGAGLKWSPYLTSGQGRLPVRLVAGQMITLGRRAGGWSYLMLSAEAPASRTHFTGGVTAGTRALFGQRTAGVLLGVEQPMGRKWMLQTDWFSGRHDLAYLIPGVVYRAAPHWMVSCGYQIPNARSQGFGAVVLELTRQP